MPKEVEQSKQPVEIPTDMAEADALLARRISNAEEREQAEGVAAAKNAKHLKKIAKHDKRMMKSVRPLDEDDEAIDEALRLFLLKRRKYILRRFGKTIRLTHGVISWVIKAPEVDAPKDVSDAIRYLERHPDGAPFLIHTPTLNKRAIATTENGNILRGLRRRGVRRSKHEFVGYKPTGFEKVITLSRRLYPRRR